MTTPSRREQIRIRDRDGAVNPMPPAEYPSLFSPEAHAERNLAGAEIRAEYAAQMNKGVATPPVLTIVRRSNRKDL